MEDAYEKQMGCLYDRINSLESENCALRARIVELEVAGRAVLEMGRGEYPVGCGGDCGKDGCAFVTLAALLGQSPSGGEGGGA